MKAKSVPIFALILALLLAGCAQQPALQAIIEPDDGPVDLHVFAAASLTEAFTEIGAQFEADHPEANLMFNFAGSQQLVQQINQGAPVDVFASANHKQMETVIAAGAIASGAQQAFVKNRLIVIVPQDNPGQVQDLKDLAKPGLKLVFAAQEVPVGQYALDFLDKASANPAFSPSYQDRVIQNVVSYEDNVKTVLAKVALGEADAGIVYTSDISGSEAGKVSRLDIPDELNVIATYPIAPVHESRHPELAQAFIEYVLSPAAQDILARYNFIPAAGTTAAGAGGVPSSQERP